MTNKEIYKKTLGFSIRALVVDVLTLLLVLGLATAGFAIMNAVNNNGLIGLVIGVIVGIIIAAVIGHFFSYALKAGQIAMMTRAVTEGELPANVYQEGKKAVKERFLTVAAYYAATKAIKAIFNEIGRGITKAGNAIGGDAGGYVGSAISTVIQIVVSYLCDCCLGWVFYRTDKKALRATLEGAVMFFKHGKTFAKNMGRVFGIGLLSLVLIGGAFFGIFALIFTNLPTTFSSLAAEIVEAGTRLEIELPEFLLSSSAPMYLALIGAGIIALVIWGCIHATFIRPFILTGVLKNYLTAGMQDVPSESEFAEVGRKSSKFAQFYREIDREA